MDWREALLGHVTTLLKAKGEEQQTKAVADLIEEVDDLVITAYLRGRKVGHAYLAFKEFYEHEDKQQ